MILQNQSYNIETANEQYICFSHLVSQVRTPALMTWIIICLLLSHFVCLPAKLQIEFLSVILFIHDEPLKLKSTKLNWKIDCSNSLGINDFVTVSQFG